ncbi:MAG: hypothetical protein QOG49_947 [Frankiaceae bacterium]|jgi:hypothetical protein|nr:hypothetical protein [Frankiaceae bacterium]
MHDEGQSQNAKERIISDVLGDADTRDLDAERRDRQAEERDRTAASAAMHDPEADADRAMSAIERTHAGRDRDAAAIDRAALIERLSAGRDRAAEDDQPRDDS